MANSRYRDRFHSMYYVNTYYIKFHLTARWSKSLMFYDIIEKSHVREDIFYVFQVYGAKYYTTSVCTKATYYLKTIQ